MSETTIASLITLGIALGTVLFAHLLSIWRATIIKNRKRKAMLEGVREDVYFLLVEVGSVTLGEELGSAMVTTLKDIAAPILCNCVEQPQDYLMNDITSLAKIYRKYIHLKTQIHLFANYISDETSSNPPHKGRIPGLSANIHFSMRSLAEESIRQLKSLGVPISAKNMENDFAAFLPSRKKQWLETVKSWFSQE